MYPVLCRCEPLPGATSYNVRLAVFCFGPSGQNVRVFALFRVEHVETREKVVHSGRDIAIRRLKVPVQVLGESMGLAPLGAVCQMHQYSRSASF